MNLSFVTADRVRDVLALGAVVYLTWLVARHGVAWVWSKVQSIYSTAKVDIVALEARVTALEKTVAPAPKPVVAASPAPAPAVAPPVVAPPAAPVVKS